MNALKRRSLLYLVKPLNESYEKAVAFDIAGSGDTQDVADPGSRELGLITVLDRARCRIPWGEPGETDDFWDAIPIHPFLRIDSSDLPSAGTTLRAVAGERTFHIRFDCVIEDWGAAASNSGGGPGGENEHVYCEILPGNDPSDIWRIAGGMTRAAKPIITRTRRVTGEASLGGAHDVWTIPLKCDGHSHGVGTRWGVSPQAWWIEWAIPWKTLGLEGRPATLGFQYGRGQCAGAQGSVVLYSGWPHGRRPSNCAPLLEHGEALIGPFAGAPARVEFERPIFGINRGRVILGGDWPEVPGRLRVRSLDPDGHVFVAEDFQIPGAAGIAPFRYRLDRAFSSHLDLERIAKISLEVFGAGDKLPLYQARLPMDRYLGLTVSEPYEVGCEASASGSLREAWLGRVVRALPLLHRATTAQKAPSDFCLLYTDGSLAVNLMKDDPWQTMAAMIEERFSSAEDRLVGAMAFVGQKSVTKLILEPSFFSATGLHSYHSPQHELMGPLSVIRYGGGSSMCQAAVLAALLQRVSDPTTGRPFVTRVIGLSNAGGPSQTMRRYRGCEGTSSLAPFVQEPGRVGAVAVDYRGSQTLLDSTALAFFPKSEGCLATVETIVSDEELRKMGADRLAPVYAKLDIEELRRHLPNRLLSKGVMPELAPDEVVVNEPVPLREFHAPRAVFAGMPATDSEPWRDAMGAFGVRHGSVSAKCDETGLQVSVCIRGIDPARFDSRDREVESVNLVIDAAHGHLEFCHFQAGLAGARDAWLEESAGIQRLLKYLSTENHREVARIPPTSWSCEISEAIDGYLAVFTIPWEGLGMDNEEKRMPVMGLNAWVNGRHPHYEQVFFVPPRFRIAADPPDFADLYLKPGTLSVMETDFGTPFWGNNAGSLKLANHGVQDATVEVYCETELSLRRWVHRGRRVVVKVPAGGNVTACIPYVTNPEEKMSGGQNVRISAFVEGCEWFQARWLMTYAHPIAIRHRFGSELGVRGNPRPGDSQYLQRKIDYVCSRIPLFHRRTTRNGAASDFVLEAEDGSVEWNLMKPDALDQMARYIAERFDTDFDRLLGILFLACHPGIKRHQSAGHRFLAGAGPISVLRASFAGFAGNCASSALVFAGLADRLHLGGKKLGTHPRGLFDHVVTVVNWGEKHILLDADLGNFHLKADGHDFATIEDFRDGAEILSTAGPGDRARYYLFNFYRTAHQKPFDYLPYPGVFPAVP